MYCTVQRERWRGRRAICLRSLSVCWGGCGLMALWFFWGLCLLQKSIIHSSAQPSETATMLPSTGKAHHQYCTFKIDKFYIPTYTSLYMYRVHVKRDSLTFGMTCDRCEIHIWCMSTFICVIYMILTWIIFDSVVWDPAHGGKRPFGRSPEVTLWHPFRGTLPVLWGLLPASHPHCSLPGWRELGETQDHLHKVWVFRKRKWFTLLSTLYFNYLTRSIRLSL